ncbi:MAG TPA: hypothetical protein VJV96_09735 [Candidatus Angelobacter sp.]|jgi:hypothetical protein|nr:hypothetical protein [Candidatus Angelobacter sp.]
MELARLRQAVLALHGVDVDIARSKKEAEALLEKPYDAALLCHTISENTAQRLVALFRERNPGRCVIFLARSPWQESPVTADVTHCTLDGPDLLIDVVLTCQSHLASGEFAPAGHKTARTSQTET